MSRARGAARRLVHEPETTALSRGFRWYGACSGRARSPSRWSATTRFRQARRSESKCSTDMCDEMPSCSASYQPGRLDPRVTQTSPRFSKKSASIMTSEHDDLIDRRGTRLNETHGKKLPPGEYMRM